MPEAERGQKIHLKINIMKKLVVFMFFAVMAILFFSCQKEEFEIPIDKEALKLQAEKWAIPQAEEINVSSLKAGWSDSITVKIFPLESMNYYFQEDSLVRLLNYYELKKGRINRTIMFSQFIPILSNGKADMNNYRIGNLIAGCPLSKTFYLTSQNNINNMRAFFLFKDGGQFGYNCDTYGYVRLDPLADGNWVVDVSFYNPNQRYVSERINFYQDDLISLKFQMKEVSKTHIEINRKFLTEDSKTLEILFLDKNGEEEQLTVPILNEGFDEIISLTIPDIKNVFGFYICGDSGCQYYTVGDQVDMVIHIENNVVYYRLL